MVGFLVRAAIGGAVAYGVLTILDKTKALDTVVTYGNKALDKVAENLVKLEAAVQSHHADGNGGMRS